MFNLDDGSWSGISLNHSEALELLKFLTEHVSCEGGLRIFVSGASGIGQNVVAECSVPRYPRINLQKDITDYGSW